jgi:hypothetical protein
MLIVINKTIIQSAIMLNVIVQSVIMLNVYIQVVIMLGVMLPRTKPSSISLAKIPWPGVIFIKMKKLQCNIY